MKKKFALLLLSLTLIVTCALALTACNSTNGTYYLVSSSGKVEMNTYIRLNGDKWEDNEGFSGTYKIDGEKIIFYMDVFGETAEWNSGSYKDGIIKVSSYMAGNQTFVSEHHKHSYGSWEHTSEATCTADGMEVHACACGIKESRTWQPALGHSWGEWEMATDATCLTEGQTTRTCERCKTTGYDTIETKEHQFEEWDFNATKHFRYCKIGGELYEEAHSGTEVCSVCQYKKGYTIGLEYKLNDAQTSYSVVGLGSVNNTEIQIPSIHKELPVTAIKNEAFKDNSKITSIIIPDSVTSIGNSAFKGCSSITSVAISNCIKSFGESAFNGCSSLISITIPDSVTDIGNYAFSDCSSLTSVTIGNSIESISPYAFSGCSSLTSVTIGNSVKRIGHHAFDDCSSLTSIAIPDSVTSIGETTFRGCTSLSSVYITDLSAWCDITFRGYFYVSYNLYVNNELTTNLVIPDDVTCIGQFAFYNCTSLTSLTIGNGVQTIGNNAFYLCESLTSITIPDSVTSIGGDAFYCCSSLTSITIPDSVTSIGNGAFSNCSSLTSVTIGNSVTSIGNYAFSYCSSLESITIPDSVTSIRDYVFRGCTSLSRITYEGAVTQWKSISKGYWYAESNYTIYCTDGEIAKDGTVTMY